MNDQHHMSEAWPPRVSRDNLVPVHPPYVSRDNLVPVGPEQADQQRLTPIGVGLGAAAAGFLGASFLGMKAPVVWGLLGFAAGFGIARTMEAS